MSARHAAERLQNCWHGGGLSLGELRGQMKAALDEYMTSGIAAEVAQVGLKICDYWGHQGLGVSPNEFWCQVQMKAAHDQQYCSRAGTGRV